jgi:hypothetical protein
MKTNVFFCAIMFCLFFIVTQGIFLVGSSEAAVDVNDIMTSWQESYCTLTFAKISYRYRTMEVSYDLEMLSDKGRIRVTKTNPDNGSYALYTCDGNTVSTYFSAEKSGSIAHSVFNEQLKIWNPNIPAKNDLLGFMLLDIRGYRGSNKAPFLLYAMNDKVVRSRTTIEPNVDTMLGSSCYVMRITHPKTVVRIWFAPDKSMLPVRLLATESGGRIVEEISIQKVASVQTDKGLIWYPVLAKHFKEPLFGHIKQTDITVKDFKPTMTFDKTVFEPNFPTGTRVSDEIKGVSYVVGLDDIEQVYSIRKLNK